MDKFLRDAGEVGFNPKAVGCLKGFKQGGGMKIFAFLEKKCSDFCVQTGVERSFGGEMR